ncbi:cell wall hydrolase [Brevundimonas sp.]|uniref:cell wall hydrolase n=1 Tax=Brevundimonas sp. TaxID=1871086 RepID=UPI0025C48629|nr:cell wall hydrolase [Brevundimonas sp.]
MIRIVLTCITALTMAAAPAVAQAAKPVAEPQAAAPAPGSDEWLRLRGETYHSAPESAQDPAEISATAKLNESIAARNAAAEQAEAADQARFDSETQRWEADSARSSTARVQWEADVAAANAAQAQWERDRAAWEAEVAACRASRRPCITPAAPIAPRY